MVKLEEQRKIKQMCLVKLASKKVPVEAKKHYKSALDKANTLLHLARPRLVKKGM